MSVIELREEITEQGRVGRVVVFEAADDMVPSGDNFLRIQDVLEKRLGGEFKVLVIPHGCKVTEVSPYCVRKTVGDTSEEIFFGNHAEMAAYLEAKSNIAAT